MKLHLAKVQTKTETIIKETFQSAKFMAISYASLSVRRSQTYPKDVVLESSLDHFDATDLEDLAEFLNALAKELRIEEGTN